MAITSSQFEILRQLFSNADAEQKTAFLEWLNAPAESEETPPSPDG